MEYNTLPIISVGTRNTYSTVGSHTVLRVGDNVFDLICKNKKNPLFVLLKKQGLVRKRSILNSAFKRYTWQSLHLTKKQINNINNSCLNNLSSPPQYNILGLQNGQNCVTFCILILEKENINISNFFWLRLPFIFQKYLHYYRLKGGTD